MSTFRANNKGPSPQENAPGFCCVFNGWTQKERRDKVANDKKLSEPFSSEPFPALRNSYQGRTTLYGITVLQHELISLPDPT